ncbi:MAG: hypothetical protein KatS3mg023_0644 [Armatimonadota bacterium]|nr:MAG: hypothetical protein KatS3mg023_0644 [Armatimonadota bacterium]
MPSGRVHDAITILTAAAAVPVIARMHPSPDWSSVGVGIGAYLFSGLALSPDLDVNSRAYRRWGMFRFFWLPYQILVPHRHWLSHSWLLGPLLRALYFFFMLYLLLRLGMNAIDLWIVPINQSEILRALERELRLSLQTHVTWAQSALIGLIAGGVVHSLTDGFVTWFKRTL